MFKNFPGKHLFKAGVTALSLTMVMGQASATTIDFNAIPSGTILQQSGLPGTPLVTNGFQITAAGFSSGVGNTNSGNPALPDNGTNFLFGSNTQFTFTALDASPFSLSSFDAAEFQLGRTDTFASEIRVTGVFGDFSTVVQFFDLDFIHDGPGGEEDFQTFFTSGFDDIVALRIVGLNGVRARNYSLDNIVFASEGTASVPEPGALALLSLGLLGLGAVRRKRTS